MSIRRSRVLVTGGAGFIGRNLISKLINRYKCDVVVIDNFSTGTMNNLKNLDVQIIEFNVANKNISKYVKGDFDYIFHLGSPSSVILFNREPERMFRETTSGFINILKFSIERGIEKVIYASSGSVYGRTPIPQAEGDLPKPVNLYGIAKLTCEKIAEFFMDQIRSVGLRIFAGYGPGESHKGEIASPVTLFLESIINDRNPMIYGDGTQRRDFVYIDDVIDAFVKSAERNVPPIINVGSGLSYSFNELVSLINKLLSKNIEPVYIPKPSKYLETTQADITLMRSSLNIKPINLEKGLKKYLKVLGYL